MSIIDFLKGYLPDNQDEVEVFGVVDEVTPEQEGTEWQDAPEVNVGDH